MIVGFDPITLLIAFVILLATSQLPMMRGADGIPSFSKFVTLLVPVLFALGHFLPVIIGMAAIISSHGSKLLLAWIKTKPFSATETFQNTYARRDPAEGIERTK